MLTSDTKTNSHILCIDFDSFFASCEQHFNPNLRGKPIGVTATNGRTCVIAASREAKRYGVVTGGSTFEARRLCPDIQFVSADFDRYLAITKKFIEVSHRYSPSVEVFSLDELFLDVTPMMKITTVHDTVASLKLAIRDEIGPAITVSVGYSYNKLLAKLASGLDKPDGYFHITRDNLDEVYGRIALTDICGIGSRIARRLHLLGIHNLLQLRQVPFHTLKLEFGPFYAYHLLDIAFGRDASLVAHFQNVSDVAKSVSRNYCLARNEYDKRRVQENLYALCEELGKKLRRLKLRGRTVGLSLRGSYSRSERHTVGRYINSGQDIYEVCLFLQQGWAWGDEYVRQISIWVTNLLPEEACPFSLFENKKRSLATSAVDRINDKYGRIVVKNGVLTHAPTLETKPNGFLADKYIRRELSQM